MDQSDNDQKATHMTHPPEFLELDKLLELTNVEYYKINADDFKNDQTLQDLRKSRGYSYEDTVRITPQMQGYDDKMKMFFREHIHSDEEIRLIVDGSGYFDVRDKNDRWIRIECAKNDLLILPAGIYHRFTVDKKDFVEANRYFIGEPVWTAINRPADDHPSRTEYLKKFKA